MEIPAGQQHPSWAAKEKLSSERKRRFCSFSHLFGFGSSYCGLSPNLLQKALSGKQPQKHGLQQHDAPMAEKESTSPAGKQLQGVQDQHRHQGGGQRDQRIGPSAQVPPSRAVSSITAARTAAAENP